MQSEFSKRCLNLLLRILSMGSRFLLIFALAGLLEPGEVGLYGLIAASLGFGILLIGGDYYTYSHRKLLAEKKEFWPGIIYNQIIATLVLYAIFIPLHIFIFYFGLLPSSYMFLFFSLLVLEHVAQEIYRLLIVLDEQIKASISSLLRFGLWVWIYIPLMIFYPSFNNLKGVLLAWVLGCIFSIILSLLFIYRTLPNWKKVKINWKWIQEGYKICFTLLVATVCLRALFTVDRYVVEALVNSEMLAVYVLYVIIAFSILSFLEPTVLSFLYPRLVAAWQKKQYLVYKKIMKEITVITIAISLSLAILLALITPYLLIWIGNTIYTGHDLLLWVLLGASVMYAIAMIPHYGLYAKNADKGILFAHISSLVVFFLVVYVLANIWATGAVAVALLIACAWMCIIKALLYFRIRA